MVAVTSEILPPEMSSTSANAHRPRSRIGLVISLLLSSLVTMAFLDFLFAEGEPEEVIVMFKQVDLRGAGLFVLLSLIGVLVRAGRYRVLLREILGAESTPSFLRLILITFARNTLVDILPARAGEAGYIYLARRSGVPIASGTSSLGFCLIVDIFVLMTIVGLFFLGALIVPQRFLQQTSVLHVVLALALVFGLVAALLGVIQYLSHLFRFAANRLLCLNPPSWLTQGLMQMAEDFSRLARSGVLGTICWYTFWLRVLKYGSLYVLFLAVVHQWGLGVADIHPVASMVAFILAEASASLPISGLLGFGMYEGFWSMALAFADIQVPSVIKVGFIVHLITQMKACCFGFAAIAILFFLPPVKESRARGPGPMA